MWSTKTLWNPDWVFYKLPFNNVTWINMLDVQKRIIIKTKQNPKILSAYLIFYLIYPGLFLFNQDLFLSKWKLRFTRWWGLGEESLCNRCPLSTDKPWKDVLASSTCFEIGNELRKFIYKCCARLQNGAHVWKGLRKELSFTTVEEGSSAHLLPFSSLKLLALGEEKGLLDLPAHSQIVRRSKELYPEALKNTKRRLQFKNKFDHCSGQDRSKHRISRTKQSLEKRF